MATRDELSASFMRDLPREVEALVEACSMLPRVEPDGSSECPFAENLYFKKEEAVLRVQKLRAKRQEYIEELRRSIEEAQDTSTDPWWATHDDTFASSPRFENYFNQKMEKEEEIRVQIRELKERIFHVQVSIEMIDEFLAKAAEKRFPRVPRDQWNNAPGEEVAYVPRAGRDAKSRKFLEGE